MESDEIFKKLAELVDEDPLAAITEARRIDGDINDESRKSAILIDAGSAIKDKEAISEAIQIIRGIISQLPDDDIEGLKYNLANGLHAFSLSEPYIDASWYLSTYKHREEARYLFDSVRNSQKYSNDISTQAATNLGNLLHSSYRWIEAYDAYIEALGLDPKNSVASSGIIKILEHSLITGLGDSEVIGEKIEHFIALTNQNLDNLKKLAGKRAFNSVKNKLSDYKDLKIKAHTPPDDSYLKFIVLNNLALSPTFHEVTQDSKRWDDLSIASVSQGVEEGYRGVPPIFAMFNVMKSDYILARWLLFKAVSETIPDTGLYNDTLDYACYGVKSSMFPLVQRAALDILDKIAVASLDYLNIGGAKKAYFKSAWFSKIGDPSKWKTKIESEIKAGNTALIALSEIALDLQLEKGFLKPKSSIRNSSTHRFSVLHDLGMNTERSSGCVEHYNQEDFITEATQTIQLVRAAIIYFVEMIGIRESRLANESDGIAMPMYVPRHHHIRGEDD